MKDPGSGGWDPKQHIVGPGGYGDLMQPAGLRALRSESNCMYMADKECAV